MMNTISTVIVLTAGAYLIGSIPFGLLFVRLRANVDIRDIGSGNIGATNVKRVLGMPWAIATLLSDGLKGALPAWVAIHHAQAPSLWLPAIVSLAVICGHIYPLYLGCRPNGKGVATTLGCLLVIAPLATAVYIIIIVLAIWLSHRVSVGSLIGAFFLPPAIWFTTFDPVMCAGSIGIMVLILIRHKENIQRLAAGIEPTIHFRKRKL